MMWLGISLIILGLTWWAGRGVLLVAKTYIGIGPLPTGYTMERKSSGAYTSETLSVVHDGKVIHTADAYVYGYKRAARDVHRAAWTHYYMTKVEDAG